MPGCAPGKRDSKLWQISLTFVALPGGNLTKPVLSKNEFGLTIHAMILYNLLFSTSLVSMKS